MRAHRLCCQGGCPVRGRGSRWPRVRRRSPPAPRCAAGRARSARPCRWRCSAACRGGGAVEGERGVGFGKVVVRTHLYGPVGGVLHHQRGGAPAGVERVLAKVVDDSVRRGSWARVGVHLRVHHTSATRRGAATTKPSASVACQCTLPATGRGLRGRGREGRRGEQRARQRRGGMEQGCGCLSVLSNMGALFLEGSSGVFQMMGWCTVTSLVPSGKVASTWMSGSFRARLPSRRRG
jgi:hypothetical protein